MHSRYDRQLSDAATAGREVLIRLRVRRLFCGNAECARNTFAEQVPELAGRHARRTTILRVLTAVALALGGRAGARPPSQLAASVSRMTRLLRGLESHRPVDVLTDRTAQTLAQWLHAHPGVQVVCKAFVILDGTLLRIDRVGMAGGGDLPYYSGKPLPRRSGNQQAANTAHARLRGPGRAGQR